MYGSLVDFFPSPPKSYALPCYIEDLAEHMANMVTPQRETSFPKYDDRVHKYIDLEAEEDNMGEESGSEDEDQFSNNVFTSSGTSRTW